MYRQIITEVQQQPKPDLVFLTGDLSFKGADDEYRSLEEAFISPLKAALPPSCPFFLVPGNHDLDRKAAVKPRLWMGDQTEAGLFQAVDDAGARKRKEMLIPRFTEYAAFDRRISTWGKDWLHSEDGSVWWLNSVNGIRVAIVGLNTAWLCQDDDDWGRLTPGRYMVQRALDAASEFSPELLFVLGHHPLAGLAIEHEPSDGPRVIERLQRAKAIYLHGHLHASGTGCISNANHSTLTIQAPSAFQAKDDKRWRNGLMWGQVDLSNGCLYIEPKLWNEDKTEYKFDIDAGYEAQRVRLEGRDTFRLALPGRSEITGSVSGSTTPPKKIVLPLGWEILDRAAVAAVREQSPSIGEMVGFFDGRLPTWRLVLAKGVQPRAIVERLATRLQSAYSGASRPEVLLLAAAGGEGKSTALLHAAASLIESDDHRWHCLHRSAVAAPLPEDLLSRLPAVSGQRWVVVIDDADNIALALLAAVKQLGARTDVHVLIAARDAEWQLKHVTPGMWHPSAAFHMEHLTGLDLDDAKRIVSGWHAWGDAAMGRLAGWDDEDAAAALVKQAHDLSAREEEGALLGALLATRKGEDIRDHVRTLVSGLGKEPLFGSLSLRDVYAMVASMHAENQLYLSRSVLGFALGCEQDELEYRALRPLRLEAMLDTGDTYILTRHRRVAEAACTVLREDEYNLDRFYPFLARAALLNFTKNHTNDPDIRRWNVGLPQHFVERGNRWWPIAREVAKAMYNVASNDSHRLTVYTSTLRRTGYSAEAMELLKSTATRFRGKRDVIYEWAAVAGMVGDFPLDVWLGARSIADGPEPIDAERCKLSLSGLSAAFRELFEATGNRKFARARLGCGVLGLLLQDIDTRARDIFEKDVAESRIKGISDPTPSEAVIAIQQAAIEAADESNNPGFFEDILDDPDRYTYKSLLSLIKNGENNGARFYRRRNETRRRS
jgi:hypothetical protein